MSQDQAARSSLTFERAAASWIPVTKLFCIRNFIPLNTALSAALFCTVQYSVDPERVLGTARSTLQHPRHTGDAQSTLYWLVGPARAKKKGESGQPSAEAAQPLQKRFGRKRMWNW
jgi:hypothetical protein